MNLEYRKYFFLTKTNIKKKEILEMDYEEMEEEFESLFHFYKQENGMMKNKDSGVDGTGILEIEE